MKKVLFSLVVSLLLFGVVGCITDDELDEVEKQNEAEFEKSTPAKINYIEDNIIKPIIWQDITIIIKNT